MKPPDDTILLMATKKEFIQIALTPQLKEAIIRAADERYMTMTALIMLALAKQYPDLTDAILRDK